MDGALVFFTNYGQPGLFLGGAFILFRYLLTRHDKLAQANLAELKEQVRNLTRRAVRAELFLRAYLRAGYSLPEKEVLTELRLGQEVSSLFPEFDTDDDHLRDRHGDKGHDKE